MTEFICVDGVLVDITTGATAMDNALDRARFPQSAGVIALGDWWLTWRRGGPTWGRQGRTCRCGGRTWS